MVRLRTRFHRVEALRNFVPDSGPLQWPRQGSQHWCEVAIQRSRVSSDSGPEALWLQEAASDATLEAGPS